MRRTILLLTVMSTSILLAGGVALAASLLDQEQTDTASGVGFDASYPLAQTFTAGLSGSVDKVSVTAWRAGSTGVGDMLVSIQTLDEAGFPSGTVLGSGSADVDGFATFPPGDPVDIPLTQPAPVSAGTKYALVATSANAVPEGGSVYSWSGSTNDAYDRGDALGRRDGQWEHRSNNGENVDFAFKTFVAEPDTTAPRVTSTVPAGNATGVAPGTNVSAVFSEAMTAGSINTRTVKLMRAGTTTVIPAAVTYDATAKKVVLNPDSNLRLGTRYKAVVTTGARDLAGNLLDQNPSVAGNQSKSWVFTVRN